LTQDKSPLKAADKLINAESVDEALEAHTELKDIKAEIDATPTAEELFQLESEKFSSNPVLPTRQSSIAPPEFGSMRGMAGTEVLFAPVTGNLRDAVGTSGPEFMPVVEQPEVETIAATSEPENVTQGQIEPQESTRPDFTKKSGQPFASEKSLIASAKSNGVDLTGYDIIQVEGGFKATPKQTDDIVRAAAGTSPIFAPVTGNLRDAAGTEYSNAPVTENLRNAAGTTGPEFIAPIAGRNTSSVGTRSSNTGTMRDKAGTEYVTAQVKEDASTTVSGKPKTKEVSEWLYRLENVLPEVDVKSIVSGVESGDIYNYMPDLKQYESEIIATAKRRLEELDKEWNDKVAAKEEKKKESEINNGVFGNGNNKERFGISGRDALAKGMIIKATRLVSNGRVVSDGYYASNGSDYDTKKTITEALEQYFNNTSTTDTDNQNVGKKQDKLPRQADTTSEQVVQKDTKTVTNQSPQGGTDNADVIPTGEKNNPVQPPAPFNENEQDVATEQVGTDDNNSFEHSGIKIYRDRFNGEIKWFVQDERNRGTNKTFGDTIHSTVEEAKEYAETESKRMVERTDREKLDAEEEAKAQAKKETNKKKSLQERRADAILDKPHTYKYFKRGATRREAMQEAIANPDYRVEEKQVRDSAAKKRDEDIIAVASRQGYHIKISNPNIPVVKAAIEAAARIEKDDYFKPEYRVYRKDDGFYNISKTEYDYAQSLNKPVTPQVYEQKGDSGAAQPFNPETAIKIAADDIESLRPIDVYRVLDSVAPENLVEMRSYIIKNHKTNQRMLDSVRKAWSELGSSATPYKSTGHIAFSEGYEYYETEDGDIHRAPVSNPIGDNGRRSGRFEATQAAKPALMKMLSGETTAKEEPSLFSGENGEVATQTQTMQLVVEFDKLIEKVRSVKDTPEDRYKITSILNNPAFKQKENKQLAKWIRNDLRAAEEWAISERVKLAKESSSKLSPEDALFDFKRRYDKRPSPAQMFQKKSGQDIPTIADGYVSNGVYVITGDNIPKTLIDKYNSFKKNPSIKVDKGQLDSILNGNGKDADIKYAGSYDTEDGRIGIFHSERFGDIVTVNADYAEYILSIYPKAKVVVDNKFAKSPVRFYDKGKVVAALMPMFDTTIPNANRIDFTINDKPRYKLSVGTAQPATSAPYSYDGTGMGIRSYTVQTGPAKGASFSVLEKDYTDEKVREAYEKTLKRFAAKLSLGEDTPGTFTSKLTASQRKTVAQLEASGTLRIVSEAEAREILRKAGIDPKYMVAWHGSPHDFEQFSTGKIGTGEGAQAYGYGLYFAGAKDVAQWYKDKLAMDTYTINGVVVDSVRPEILADIKVNGRASAVKSLQDRVKALEADGVVESDYGVGFRLKLLKSDIKKVEALPDGDVKQGGKLYQVELAPAEDEYLLWDRPLSEQSEKVKAALKAAYERGDNSTKTALNHSWDSADHGKEFYEDLMIPGVVENEKQASEYLHSLGIRGIKYLDGTSRGKGDGDYNYVVFDDADVKITAKYSQSGKIQGFALPDGTAYIIPENISGSIWNVVRHEIGVHTGNLLQSEQAFTKLLASIEERSTEDGRTGEAIRAAMERVPKDTNPDHYWEETLAYLTEMSPETGIIRRFVAMVKRMLVKMGIDPKIFTATDLAAIADAAVRKEANGTSQINEFAQNAMMSIKAAGRKIQNMAAFKKWFAGSKVVDENGDPLVVYHGTTSDIDAFTKKASRTGHPSSYLGFFFTESTYVADMFNRDLSNSGPFTDVSSQPFADGANTVPVYLAIKNPKIIDAREFKDLMVDLGAPRTEEYGWMRTPKGWEKLKNDLIDKGFDGVKILADSNQYKGSGNEEYVVPQWVAFSPTQIKSIFNTKWDGSNPDILASFAGPRANSTGLDRAKQMEQNGATRRDVWKETGWWQIVPGQWSYEIDDSLASAKLENGLLSEVLDHPALFRDYPQLEKIRVRFEDLGWMSRGSYDSDKRIIKVNSEMSTDMQRSTLLHEFQHIIQGEEGNPGGASYAYHKSKISQDNQFKEQVLAKLKKQHPDIGKVLDAWEDGAAYAERQLNETKLGKEILALRKSIKNDVHEAAFNEYATTTGEAESRLVQYRLDMTPAQRKTTPPWVSLKKMLSEEGLLEDGQNIEDVLVSRKSNGPMFSVSSTAPFTGGTPRSFAQIQQWAKTNPKVQERFEKIATYWWDHDAPIERVQKELGPQPENRDYITLKRLTGKRIANEIETFDREVLKPLIKHLAKHKLKMTDIEELAHADHAPEANLQLKRVNARGYIDHAMQQMTDSEKAQYKDRLFDVQEEYVMNDQSLNERRDNYVQLMDEISDTVLSTQTEEETAIDDLQAALDTRSFTQDEIDMGTPERIQKKIDNARDRLQRRVEIATQWEDIKDRLSGMTNERSAEIKQKWDGNAAAQHGAEELRKMGRDSLRMLYESGEITEEEYDAMQRTYRYYVPLQREGKAQQKNPTGRAGLGPLARPFKVRAGSTRNVINIFANTVDRYQSTVTRKHKGIAARALYQLIRNNPDPDRWSLIEQEKIPYYDSQGNIRYYTDQKEDVNEVYIKIDGVKHLIHVDQDNESMMRWMEALKRAPTELGPFLSASRYFTRILAMLNTSFSPEFMITNFFRDIQTAGIHLETTEAKGLQKQVFKNIKSAIKGIYSAERGDESSDWSKLYRDFAKHGGKISWMQGYENVTELAEQLENELAYAEGKHPTKEKLLKLGKLVEALNTSVENGVRLATYKVLLEKGISKTKAAHTVANLTVDFTRHGTAGPLINSLYLFFNAGIQGNVRMIKAVATNRKVQKITAGIVGFGALANVLGAMMGGDDEDGESYYDKLKKTNPSMFERNMVFMLPGGKGRPYKIPMPYGYNTFFVLGNEIAGVIRGQNPTEAAARVGGTLMSFINPLASATLLQTIMPTLGDPVAQIMENKAWHGGDLMPKENPFGIPQPDSERYFKSVNPVAKFAAQGLNAITGGDKYKSGVIDMSPESIEMLVETFTGSAGKLVKDALSIPMAMMSDEGLTMNKVPFVRKIVGSFPDFTDSTIYQDNQSDVDVFIKRWDNADADEKRELRENPLFKMRAFHKSTESQLRKLNKQLKQAEKLNNAARQTFIKNRMNEIKVRYNTKYNQLAE
jgi:hypothetical protein